MTDERFKALLLELAHLGGLADPSQLVDTGRVKVGEVDVTIENGSSAAGDVMRFHVHVGDLSARGAPDAKALLKANYTASYAGSRFFGTVPLTSEAAATLDAPQASGMSAQELWAHLSQAAIEGKRLWDEACSQHGGHA
ncbi:hypothetical protein [Ramlibacter albus]|uniref:Uncharacterized protein n=1 Tax=Ramlibacter albus TaxID=2079448 RepID=A0A923M507_9BURK|nr:hypothetical protein [Ramlibacter albus]MBC5764307.1 hypothetical protein [Ramlibacter albus]